MPIFHTLGFPMTHSPTGVSGAYRSPIAHQTAGPRAVALAVACIGVRLNVAELREPRLVDKPFACELAGQGRGAKRPRETFITNMVRKHSPELQGLLGGGRASDALCLWEVASSNAGTASILSLCNERAAAGCNILGDTLIAALNASLRTHDTARSLQILSALLCFASCRLKAGAAATLANALQPVLLAAVTRLFAESDDTTIITGEPELALSVVFESIVALTVVAGGNAKKHQQQAATQVKLSADTLRALASVLLRRRSGDDGGHKGHAGLLRTLGTSVAPHEPTSEALAAELRRGGTRAKSALSFLAATAQQLRLETQPAAALHTITFVHALSRHAPLAIAAGLDVADGLVAAAVTAVEALPAAAQRTSANKLLLEMVAALGSVLPATVLAPSSLRHLARMLLSRAADADADLPSRTHASIQLAELLEASQPWAARVRGPDAVELEEKEAEAMDVEDDGSGDDEDVLNGGGSHLAGSACERDYSRSTGLLLGALAEAVEASRPLTSKLLVALAALLRRNPWCAPAVDLSLNASAAQTGWARLVGAQFDGILGVLEHTAADAPSATPSPLLDVLGGAVLGPHCLGVLLRRMVRVASPTPGDTAKPSQPSQPSQVASALLRRQLLGAERIVRPATAAAIARRLADVAAANECGVAESDALLSSVLLGAADATHLLPALARLLEGGRAVGGEAERTEDEATSASTARAALALLARGAHLAPTVATALLPPPRVVQEMDRAMDAALSTRTRPPADHPRTDVDGAALRSLLEMYRVAVEHGGSGRGAFLALVSRAPSLLLVADTAEPLMNALFAFPLPVVRAALTSILDDLKNRAAAADPAHSSDGGAVPSPAAQPATDWAAAASLFQALGAAAPRLARSLHNELRGQRHPGPTRPPAPHAAADSAPAVADANEFDYMLEEADAAEEEAEMFEALSMQLRMDAVRIAPDTSNRVQTSSASSPESTRLLSSSPSFLRGHAPLLPPSGADEQPRDRSFTLHPLPPSTLRSSGVRH